MEKVLIIDFGSQTVQLIAKQLRLMKVYCEIMPYYVPFQKIEEFGPSAIILSGGNKSCYEEGAPTIDKKIFYLGVPLLGICYGFQLMSMLLSGRTEKAKVPEFGKTQVTHRPSKLFSGIPKNYYCLMSHFDSVTMLPQGFVSVAHTADTPFAAIQNEKKKLYGLQYHPEVDLSQFGKEVLQNFLFKIAKLKGDWSLKDFVQTSVEEIKEKTKGKKVLCALSGGVDSAVAAMLVHKAIGENLICVFVDHGLMRKGEAEEVVRVFKGEQGFNLIALDKEEHFLNHLKGVADPEQKRKIIGREFIRCFEEEAKKIGGVSFLVQGTIYPDIIESGTKSGETIKTHHNVGGLPSVMDFEGIIEPLAHLFKDEVRRVGRTLGLPESIVMRQPFPGPGLAVRVLGEVTKEKLEILREADFIFRDEIAKAGLDKDIWQYFAVLPNIFTTGVMGDKRTYLNTVALRAVQSSDGMTADWSKIPYEVLEKVSSRIANKVSGVSRVVLDITGKPPATIEWE